jgi:hypothetical protein
MRGGGEDQGFIRQKPCDMSDFVANRFGGRYYA